MRFYEFDAINLPSAEKTIEMISSEWFLNVCNNASVTVFQNLIMRFCEFDAINLPFAEKMTEMIERE
jgi:hypothetical protein